MNAEQAKEYLRLGVALIDEATKNNRSGSTFTGVIVTEDGNLVSAHLGDSPASAVIIDKYGNLRECVRLVVEHKPGEGPGTSPSGREFFDNGSYRAITSDDGWGRLGVAMTHALGDAPFGDALSHTPELHIHQIQERLQTGDRLFLLVTSDGAHNERKGVTHHGHAENLAERLTQNRSLSEISNQIAADSASIRDNVTVALLEVEKGKGAIVAVFDGHGGAETSDQAKRILRELSERFDNKDSSAPIEEVVEVVALEERWRSLQKRLDDAQELSGEFTEGAKLLEREQLVKEKLAAVAKVRDLQTQSISETGEESERLRREIQELYDEHEMDSYGHLDASFEENVEAFESDWKADLSDIQARIEAYDHRVLTPAIENIRREISDIEKKVLAA
jgi:serine/threonine protein phosphatase PrpC